MIENEIPVLPGPGDYYNTFYDLASKSKRVSIVKHFQTHQSALEGQKQKLHRWNSQKTLDIQIRAKLDKIKNQIDQPFLESQKDFVSPIT